MCRIGSKFMLEGAILAIDGMGGPATEDGSFRSLKSPGNNVPTAFCLHLRFNCSLPGRIVRLGKKRDVKVICCVGGTHGQYGKPYLRVLRSGLEVFEVLLSK